MDATWPPRIEDPVIAGRAVRGLLHAVVRAHAQGQGHPGLDGQAVAVKSDGTVEVRGFGSGPQRVEADLRAVGALQLELMAGSKGAGPQDAIQRGFPEPFVDVAQRLRSGALTVGSLAVVELAEAGADLHGEVKVPARRPPSRIEAPSSCVGREGEAGMVWRALERREPVVVLGPGGIGKSTLTRHVARSWAGPAVWVGLGHCHTALDVEHAVTEALGLTAVEHAPRGTLLVLDECEGVALALVPLLDSWRALSAELGLLLSSRVLPTGFRGTTVELGPLPEEAAVDLLRRVASGRNPSYHSASPAVLGALCAALDRVPLALEVAGSYAAALGPNELAARFGAGRAPLGRPLDASWAMLPDPARELLSWLALFHTGFDVPLVERTCALAAPGEDPVGLLVTLRDHSWVTHPREGRFRVLTPVRTFLLSTATAEGRRVEAERHHALEVLALVQALRPGFTAGRTSGPDLVALSRDLDDAAAAHRGRDAALTGRLLAASSLVALQLGDGARALTDARAVLDLAETEATLVGLGHLRVGQAYWRMHDHASARPHLERVLQSPDVPHSAHHAVRRMLAESALDRGEHGVGVEVLTNLFDDALAAGAPAEAAITAFAIVATHAVFVADTQAIAWAERAVEVSRGAGLEHLEGACLTYQGFLLTLADSGRGLAMARRGIALSSQAGKPLSLSFYQLVAAETATGNADEAERLHRELVQVDRSAWADEFREVGAARIALVRGEVEVARAGIERALEAFERRPTRSLTNQTRLLATMIALIARDPVGVEAHRRRLEADYGSTGAWRDIQHSLALLAAALDADSSEARVSARGLIDAFVGDSTRTHPPREVLAMARWALEGRAAPAHVLRLAPGARTFSVDAGAVVDLSRKPVLRRILAHIASSHAGAVPRACTRDELIAAGWPGERIFPEAALNRLYVALNRLRSEGLRDLVVTTQGGFGLAPGTVVEWATPG